MQRSLIRIMLSSALEGNIHIILFIILSYAPSRKQGVIKKLNRMKKHFRTSIPRNFGFTNRGRFREILFALKTSGYLCLAHLEIFVFEDLVTATSLGIF